MNAYGGYQKAIGRKSQLYELRSLGGRRAHLARKGPILAISAVSFATVRPTEALHEALVRNYAS